MKLLGLVAGNGDPQRSIVPGSCAGASRALCAAEPGSVLASLSPFPGFSIPGAQFVPPFGIGLPLVTMWWLELNLR